MLKETSNQVSRYCHLSILEDCVDACCESSSLLPQRPIGDLRSQVSQNLSCWESSSEHQTLFCSHLKLCYVGNFLMPHLRGQDQEFSPATFPKAAPMSSFSQLFYQPIEVFYHAPHTKKGNQEKKKRPVGRNGNRLNKNTLIAILIESTHIYSQSM